MLRPFINRRAIGYALLALALVSLGAACGGGGGSGGEKARAGRDTAPQIVDLQTPVGLQGKRGADPVNGYVNLAYALVDREFDPVDFVEVEFGIDPNLDDALIEYVYSPATPAPGGSGQENLDASPKTGTQHFFFWDSFADIGTQRYVTQDFRYSDDGRVLLDQYGEEIFDFFAGAVLRFRTVVEGVPGDWIYTEPFDVNNNRVPWVEVGEVDQPDPAVAPNEHVVLNWTGFDEDGDTVTISVDFAVLPDGYDVSGKTAEELGDELAWSPATSSTVEGQGTLDLPASEGGVPHTFGWNSMYIDRNALPQPKLIDAGTIHKQVLLRVRPLDEKSEVGDWVYMAADFELDNYTVFNDPAASLPGPRVGHTATRLLNNTILVVGGAESEGGPALRSASLIYVGTSQTTLVTIDSSSLVPVDARRDHTATRLRADENGDGQATVLLAGGLDEFGDPLGSLEIFDPAAASFTKLGVTLDTPRYGHSAVLMHDGRVLIVGGRDENGVPLRSAEIYDPHFTATDPEGKVTVVGDLMNVGRYDAQILALPGVRDPGDTNGSGDDVDGIGEVLIAGGIDENGLAVLPIELYDPYAPAGSEFRDVVGSLTEGRIGMALVPTLEESCPAVAIGGMGSPPTNSIDRYDPLNRTFVAGASMNVERANAVAIQLGNGNILIAGGQVDEAGVSLTTSAEVYDVASDAILDPVPNGELPRGLRNAVCVMLANGRPLIVGGVDGGGATDALLVYTVRSDDGFNKLPRAQVLSPEAAQPHSYGVLIKWRGTDLESDRTRIRAEWLVEYVSGDPGAEAMKADPDLAWKLDRWNQADLKLATTLGETSAGTTGLTVRSVWKSQAEVPIEYPDMYPNDPTYVPSPGEHLFVWDPAADGLPKEDYGSVKFRITIFGAEEGETATTSTFAITENAPVIARVDAPLTEDGKVFGNVVFPYSLQDADKDLARVVWEWALDLSGPAGVPDGKITDHDKLDPADETPWYPATAAIVDRAIPGDPNSPYSDVDPKYDLATDDGAGNPAEYIFIWDSVADVGAPDPSRSDVFMRITPYDYKTSGTPDYEQSLGIAPAPRNFVLWRDPDGLYLVSWALQSAAPGNGWAHYNSALNEPIKFVFSQTVDPTTVNKDTLQVLDEGTRALVDGDYVLTDEDAIPGPETVTFHPQVQEEPATSEVILQAGTGYEVFVPGYDPSNSATDQPTVKKAGADTDDANEWNLLTGGGAEKGFFTASGGTYLDLTPGAPTLVSAVNTSSDPRTPVEVTLSERIDPDTLDADALRFYIDNGNGVESPVPGTYTLTNSVNASGVEVGLVIFTPGFDLPGSTTITVGVGPNGLTDFFGNDFAGTETSTFTTDTGSFEDNQFDEGFDAPTYRDASMTNAFWGSTAPANYSGPHSGQPSRATGQLDFGDGLDGDLNYLDFSTTYDPWRRYSLANALILDSDVKQDWNFASVNIPSGYTLILRGSKPINIRSQGDCYIAGTIEASGQHGDNGDYCYVYSYSSNYYYRFRHTRLGSTTYFTMYSYNTGSFAPNPGGQGGPGGGSGGDGGDENYITGNQGPDYGTNGSGQGYGGRGQGMYRSSTGSFTVYASGGGGGGHASAGVAGPSTYYSYSYYRRHNGGTGGSTYGTAGLLGGLEGGSGGGGGGPGTWRYPSSSFYYTRYEGFTSGGGGGGGGGAVGFWVAGDFDLASSGRIYARGGNGGRSTARTYYNTTIYGGGGGGGSAGSVAVYAKSADINGIIDLRGGSYGQANSSYCYGGAGGDGRFLIATAEAAWSLQGVVRTGSYTEANWGNSTFDWTVSSNITVDTSTGRYGPTGGSLNTPIPGWVASEARAYVNDFTLNAGYTITVQGDRAFIVVARGKATVNGTIDASGEGRADRPRALYAYTYYSTYFYIFDVEYYIPYLTTNYFRPTGGQQTKGPSGGNGGTNYFDKVSGTPVRYNSYYGYYRRLQGYYHANATHGLGRTGLQSISDGAGEGGIHNGKLAGSTTSYHYVHFYDSGCGGGGSGVESGTTGSFVNYGYYYSRYVPSYRGVMGRAGTSTVTLTALRPHRTQLPGGSGGGGGPQGGQSYNRSGPNHYYKRTYGHGHSGGAGGGAVAVVSKGLLTMGGTVKLLGGKGGGCSYGSSYNYYYQGAGGGGSGGNLILHSEGGFALNGPYLDMRGGAGGVLSSGSTVYRRAGNGGRGGVLLTAPTEPSAPTVNLLGLSSNVYYGSGTVGSGSYPQMDTLVSTWQDTGCIAPTYVVPAGGWLDIVSGTAVLEVQGAHAAPDGTRDDTTQSPWRNTATEAGLLKGYRFFRFRLSLTLTAGAGAPVVEKAAVRYQFFEL